MKNNYKGFSVTALVLGIVAIVFSWMPYVNIISMILAIIALVFGLIAIFKTYKDKISGMAISGTVLAIVSLFFAWNINTSATNGINKGIDETNKAIDDSQKSPVTEGKDSWNQSDYENIQVGDNGTSYQELVDRFGEPSSTSNSSDGDNFNSKTATWDNIKDGTVGDNVMISFDNDKVSFKSSSSFN